MTPWIWVGAAFGLFALLAVFVFGATWPSRLEFSIAMRYLKSRGLSRLVSFITVIAVLGVTVGVAALVGVLGVMNGLQADLRLVERASKGAVTAKTSVVAETAVDVSRSGGTSWRRSSAVRAAAS